tara:strand:- start:414 stop:581 length:168 start_codon:yes stop_codon:yes gene_type:complete
MMTPEEKKQRKEARIRAEQDYLLTPFDAECLRRKYRIAIEAVKCFIPQNFETNND